MLDALADAKNVAIRVTHVHFTDVPGHVGRWKGNVQPGGYASFVDAVNVVHPR